MASKLSTEKLDRAMDRIAGLPFEIPGKILEHAKNYARPVGQVVAGSWLAHKGFVDIMTKDAVNNQLGLCSYTDRALVGAGGFAMGTVGTSIAVDGLIRTGRKIREAVASE
jgi:hypothetical protein